MRSSKVMRAGTGSKIFFIWPNSMSRMDTIQGGSLFKGALNGDITVAVKENPRKVLRKFFWSGLSGFTPCITGNDFKATLFIYSFKMM